ncbi:MAG: FHA domain-containing protein [Planctomycetes bacterium]|nr:FHA domain-containing protein [Planctomycetota bacterium]
MSTPILLADYAPGVPLDDPQVFRAARPEPALYVGGLPSFQRLRTGSEFATRVQHSSDEERKPAPARRPVGGEGGLLPLKKDGGGSASAMITLGRFDNNDLVVPDDRVSKFHGHFQDDDQGWTFTDAGSTNGTLLDGTALVPFRPYPLNPGSTLVISNDVTLVYLTPLQICRLLRGDSGLAPTRALVPDTDPPSS